MKALCVKDKCSNTRTYDVKGSGTERMWNCIATGCTAKDALRLSHFRCTKTYTKPSAAARSAPLACTAYKARG